jgi:membrane protein implicated in regulation of membrane protease activity
MIVRIIAELGPWSWMVAGLVLLGAEILVPGFFLIWIGIAALAVGALSLALWDAAFWTWQVQVLAFLVLALASALAGRALMRGGDVSDQPLLNRRAEQLVGRTASLEEAIVNGHGRVRMDDTTWRVTGPDLAPGTRVRIVRVEKGSLVVEADQAAPS